jgi:hypothetical protein
MNAPTARFHALLFVPDRPSSADIPNLGHGISLERRHLHYLAMAVRLGRGVVRNHGTRLTVLTNRAAELDALVRSERGRLAGQGAALELVDIPFGDALPAAARHFSAAHKLFAFRYFAERNGYSILLDLDLICQRPFGPDVERRIRSGSPLVYDISDQIFPAYSYERVAEELRLISGRRIESRWFGGEFIGGPDAFFGDLFERLQAPMGAYRTHWQSLSVQGEEIMLSAALNEIRQEKGADYLCDIAPLGVMRRHWGIPTMHDAPRFDRTEDVSFIHLPAMKSLLASSWDDGSVLRAVRGLDRLPPRLSLRARSLLSRLAA